MKRRRFCYNDSRAILTLKRLVRNSKVPETEKVHKDFNAVDFGEHLRRYSSPFL